MRRLRDWWHDPPHWRPLMCVSYLVAVIWGVAGIAYPHYAVTKYFGDGLTVTWAGIVTVGALVALHAVYSPRWWQERLGIKIAGVGMALDLSAVAFVNIVDPGARGLDVFVISFAAILLWRRHQGITDWDYEPPEIRGG